MVMYAVIANEASFDEEMVYTLPLYMLQVVAHNTSQLDGSWGFWNTPKLKKVKLQSKHRRSQDFLWGALFFPKKSWRPF